jgi:hypothetical protein
VELYKYNVKFKKIYAESQNQIPAPRTIITKIMISHLTHPFFFFASAGWAPATAGFAAIAGVGEAGAAGATGLAAGCAVV